MPPAPSTSWCPPGLRAGPPGLGRQGGQLAPTWPSPRRPEAARDLAATPGLAGWSNLLPKACPPENFLASPAQEMCVFLRILRKVS